MRETLLEPAVSAVSIIAGAVREGCPEVQALLLTGSTARNEATIVTESGGLHWLSDLEFLAVVPDAILASASVRLDDFARRLTEQLRLRNIRVSVELTASPQSLFSRFRPTIFAFELKTHGAPVFGDADYLGLISAFSWNDVPLEEGWRLLSNRIVELLDFRRRRSYIAAVEQFYALTKHYLDVLTSLSLFCGVYFPTYRERAANAESLLAPLASRVPADLLASFIQGVGVAAAFKADPNQPQFEGIRLAGADLTAALDAAGWRRMPEVIDAIEPAAWEWELERITGVKIQTRGGLRRAIRDVYGFWHRAKGWLKLTIHPELRSGARFFPRMPALFVSGAPRALVYFCARTLLNTDCGGAELRAATRLLPVLYPGPASSREDLAEQCVKNWNTYLRRSYV
jgi:hypothetical protein